MSDIATIRATIAGGDWRLIAGTLAADMYRTGWKPRTVGVRDGVNMTIYDDRMVERVADVSLRIGDAMILIEVKAHDSQAAAWEKELTYLAEVVEQVRQLHEMTRPTANDIVETYYRRKAAGGKVTLKMLAEESGYTYAYLQKAKQRYDAAGRWGSKKRIKQPK